MRTGEGGLNTREDATRKRFPIPYESGEGYVLDLLRMSVYYGIWFTRLGGPEFVDVIDHTRVYLSTWLPYLFSTYLGNLIKLAKYFRNDFESKVGQVGKP